MKIAKILGLVAMMAIFGLTLTSCGGYSAKAAEKMQEKFDDGEMKKDDYTKCLEWVEAYIKDWEELTEKGIKEVKNEKQWEKQKEEIEEQLEKDWEDIDTIAEILAKAYADDDKDMGSSNMNKFEKLMEKASDKQDKVREQLAKKLDVGVYDVELPEL